MRKSNIYTKLENLFNTDLVTIARKYNYSEENILILQNNLIELQNKYPDTYNIINCCNHRRDSRPAVLFFQDLICSWIFEDIVVQNLKNLGLNINLNGNCSQRKILKDDFITADSDFVVLKNNKEYHIELVQDFTGFWQNKKLCDLRDNKINKIKEQKSILLGIDMLNKKFFICSYKDIVNQGYMVDCHPVYKKPAFRLKLDNFIFKNFTWKEIYNNILLLLIEETK